MDILLKNGKIINGSGNPWYGSDLMIQGNKINRIEGFKG